MSTTSCPEELDVFVKDVCQRNTAELEEEVSALKASIFELKGKILYLIRVLQTDIREEKPSPVDPWSLPDPCADMVRQSGAPAHSGGRKKKSYRLKMALCDRGTSPRPSYTEPCTPGHTCQDREMYGDRSRFCQCDGFMGQERSRRTSCSIKTLFCGRERTATCSESCRPPQPYTDDRIPVTGSNTGDCSRCSGAVGQVKIWFQNRRMKWKRSKKAQQEAKCAKGEEKCHSPAPHSHGHQKICTPEPCSSTQTHSEHSSRKVSMESEQLYRPYVV